nr:MAG TPA: hypothetical protein [Caudoviricetes sp.]
MCAQLDLCNIDTIYRSQYTVSTMMILQMHILGYH